MENIRLLVENLMEDLDRRGVNLGATPWARKMVRFAMEDIILKDRMETAIVTCACRNCRGYVDLWKSRERG